MTVDEESGSGLKKRRGSMSSRMSLKSFDNKVSEEGNDFNIILILILF